MIPLHRATAAKWGRLWSNARFMIMAVIALPLAMCKTLRRSHWHESRFVAEKNGKPRKLKSK